MAKTMLKHCTHCEGRTQTEILRTNFFLNAADALSKVPLWLLAKSVVLTVIVIPLAFICYPLAFAFLFIGKVFPKTGILYRCTKCKRVSEY